jgi:hypothetical protein
MTQFIINYHSLLFLLKKLSEKGLAKQRRGVGGKQTREIKLPYAGCIGFYEKRSGNIKVTYVCDLWHERRLWRIILKK